jgi:hypothetical protein
VVFLKKDFGATLNKVAFNHFPDIGKIVLPGVVSFHFVYASKMVQQKRNQPYEKIGQIKVENYNSLSRS